MKIPIITSQSLEPQCRMYLLHVYEIIVLQLQDALKLILFLIYMYTASSTQVSSVASVLTQEQIEMVLQTIIIPTYETI